MNVEVSQQVPATWNEYVDGHPDASAYHGSQAVLIARESFGLDTRFLSARSDAGKLSGILPLVEQSSIVFGRFLTSLPFFTYGGILADDGEVARQLASRAAELAEGRKAQHVEFRHRSPLLEPEETAEEEGIRKDFLNMKTLFE